MRLICSCGMPPPVSATLTQTPSPAFAGLQRQRAALGHGLHRVLDQVHQHLLDLRRVDRRERQVGGASFVFDGQAAVVQLRPQQFERLLHHLVQRGELELRRRGPDGLQELGDDVIEPGDLALGDGEILFQLVADLRARRVFGQVRRGSRRARARRVRADRDGAA